MDVVCQNFIESLVENSRGLSNAYQESKIYWKPDEPPITILFGELGRCIAEDFDVAGSDINRRIFRQVEEAMASEHVDLATAVATGLIEAIVGEVARDERKWLRIASMFGKLTREHADAWRNG